MILHKRLAMVIPAAMLMLAGCGRESAEPVAEEATAPSMSEPAPQVDQAPAEAAALPRSASPEGARVYFIAPADGETVTSPVLVEFGIEGMSVVRAGDMTPNSGHHHLIVDADLPPAGLPIPADANHIHFGDGSTSTQLNLEPGQHTLELLLGDHLHIPHDPPVSSGKITITVE